MDKPLEKRPLSDVQAAIARAEEYAAAHKVPLTVERLAAELDIGVTALRRYLDEGYRPQGRSRAVVEAVRAAAGQATASVMEYALSRGSSANMHMMYLRQYAGYGNEQGAAAEPIIFEGEQEI
ncbi:MAG: hypothetical protein E7552_02585 [Ruminococcaceae bacterium]|nr:hypothetical protein [Oscillospiraceae bacterium]